MGESSEKNVKIGRHAAAEDIQNKQNEPEAAQPAEEGTAPEAANAEAQETVDDRENAPRSAAPAAPRRGRKKINLAFACVMLVLALALGGAGGWLIARQGAPSEDEAQTDAAILVVTPVPTAQIDESLTDAEREALDALAEEYVDLIISDIMMPVMDGYELVRSLRKKSVMTPVLMITARDAFDDMRLGFLSGTDVRDKDGVNACLLIAEAACWYKKTYNCTLVDAIDRLYAQYGYYGDKVTSFVLPGKDGLEKMQHLMCALREDPPRAFAGVRVTALRDYQKSTRVEGDRVEPLTLPKSNVLYFELEDGAWICVRPSGTEPKIKLYVNARTEAREMTAALLEKLPGAAVEALNARM